MPEHNEHAGQSGSPDSEHAAGGADGIDGGAAKRKEEHTTDSLDFSDLNQLHDEIKNKLGGK